MIKRVLLSAVLFIGTFSSLPANAASSEWFKTPGARMRLITRANPESRMIDAALEVQLKKGWKTYWRSPGESGIPPVFDFSASRNVARTTVKFPTPTFFDVSGARTVGYKNRVVFPIDVQTIFPDAATILDLKLVIGVCGEVCIPVLAKIKVSEPGNASPTLEVSQALNQGALSLPTGPQDDFRVVAARWNKARPKVLDIESIIDEDSDNVQLHVEGPSDWYLLPAKLTSREGNRARFSLDITDIPDDAKPATTELRFTLVADGVGIEQVLVPVQ